MLVFITTTGIAVTAHYFANISWSLSFILGAILSPPDTIAATSVINGNAFPQRNAIIFLAVAVVIIMLVIQGLGLPLLIKLLKINSSNYE